MSSVDTHTPPLLTFREAGNFELDRLARRFAMVEPAAPGTGLCDLDRMLGGFRRGSMCAVTGPAGSGKTAFVGTIALAAAGAGWKTLFVSGDLPLTEVTTRLAAMSSGVVIDVLRRGALTEKDWAAVRRAFAKEMPLYLLDDRTSAANYGDVDHRHELRPEIVIVDGINAADRPPAASAWRGQGPASPAVVASINSSTDRSDTGSVDINADVNIHLQPSRRTHHGAVTEVDAIVVRNRYGPCGAVKLILRHDRLTFVGVADHCPSG